MHLAYIIVTAVNIAYLIFSAVLDFLRFQKILDNMTAVGVPHSLLPTLGTAKAAGAAGMLLGLLGVRWIGTAAAIGVVLFFVLAVGAHLRVRDKDFGLAAAFLALATAALALDLG
ncbi:DoxX family protein [Streptacidiphilus griseoplanus]|uniref:DoxX family protein n=1 Tax=Peterkaempfera griseoplana TaxID=66896 RepID=UPI0006E2DB1C|nr:DoxX family protein [Peterkaempfera griseoplana]